MLSLERGWPRDAAASADGRARLAAASRTGAPLFPRSTRGLEMRCDATSIIVYFRVPNTQHEVKTTLIFLKIIPLA